MPLIKRKSQKAFEHNVKAEMHAGKPQNQALAISYSVKRKAKKASGGMVESGSKDMNMAHGGKAFSSQYHSKKDRHYNEKGINPASIENESEMGSAIRGGNIERAKKEAKQTLSEIENMPRPRIKGLAKGCEISASNEKRPMPDNEYHDEIMDSHNRARKAIKDGDWTDKPTEKQAIMNNGRKVLPIKRPKMVPSDAFSTRLYDKEGNLEESAKPGPYGEQPSRDMDEEGPDRQGPKVPDMQDEHSTHRKPYAKGGQIDEMHHPSKHYMQPEDDEISAHERREQDDHEMYDSPSEDEGYMHAMEHNEERPDRQGPAISDMEEPHSEHSEPYHDAEHNEDHEMEMNPAHDKHSADDSEMQPDEEKEEEHHNSIAAAIMAKKKAKEARMSDSDMDEMMRLYEGGEITRKSGKILSHDSIYADNSDQADLSRNHDEDANEEDQLSFNALRRENYNDSDLDAVNYMDSAQHGDDEESDSENEHDMISAIRRKMKSRRQF